MNEIDEMDLFAFLELQVWKAKKKREPRRTTIDKVWPQLDGTIEE